MRTLLVLGAVATAPVAACYTGPDVDQVHSDGNGQDGGTVAASGCRPDIDSIQKTVLLPRCATSGCHAGANPGGSLDLESIGADARLIGQPASECGGQILVRPGDPDGSYLIDKLASPNPACGQPMPIGASSLDADDVACIRAWITSLSPSAAGPDGGGDSGASAACAPGLSSCSSRCVDTKVDPKNCGQCGTTCPVACANGACVTSCPAPTTNCSNACVHTATSATNCGACGNKCPAGQICSGSTCSCGSMVSFGSQLQPILTSQCATTGCHTGNMPKATLNLTPGKSHAELVNVASSACSGKSLVVPGAVDQSYLMNKLTGVGMCAGSVMPKAGGALPASQIELFRTWICNGAPNN